MKRTVNHALIQRWIDENSLIELSQACGLSVYTLMKIKNRNNPIVPRKDSSQLKLAAAIGIDRDKLFPLVNSKGEEVAS